MNVTIMGLGLHGGGYASTHWWARHGAQVTVTDLQPPQKLLPTIKKIESLKERSAIELHLGEHRDEDFRTADIVIKNPSVPRTSRYLEIAREGGAQIETDISMLLSRHSGPIIAVTGTKGKSTVAAAIYTGLRAEYPRARLGGNIGKSPLDFLDELAPEDPVVLELSSFQLGDLKLCSSYHAHKAWPKIAVITSLFPDHLDWYPSYEHYVADKAVIVAHQTADDYVIMPKNGEIERYIVPHISASAIYVPPYPDNSMPDSDGDIEVADSDSDIEVADSRSADARNADTRSGDFAVADTAPCHIDPALPGHTRHNLRMAAQALRCYGIPSSTISEAFANWEGLPHRLEHVAQWEGITFYNDSAATVPHAVLTAIASVRNRRGPLILIAGGSDKKGDMAPFLEIAAQVDAMLLLAGKGSDRIISLLRSRGRPTPPLYDTLDGSLADAVQMARPEGIVLLSPGCASFGMFNNEFERGDKFKAAVSQIIGLQRHDR